MHFTVCEDFWHILVLHYNSEIVIFSLLLIKKSVIIFVTLLVVSKKSMVSHKYLHDCFQLHLSSGGQIYMVPVAVRGLKYL